MIIQRFRKQGSCKYVDQREGSKVKSGSELSDGAYCFSGDATYGHCNGCCLLDPSEIDRSWRWRGGPAEGICVHERWIHHPWMKSSWCGREEHSHYGMHFGNMYYSSDVCVMHVLGGYTASSYSPLDRFVVHFQ